MSNTIRGVHLTFILILSIIVVFWITDLTRGKVPYIDQVSREFVTAVSGTPVFTFFRWMTELGSKTFLWPFTILMMIVLFILFKNIVPAIYFGLGTLASQLINRLIKHLVKRERPSISAFLNAEGFSFPSGHAMTSIVCYGLLAYFLARRFPKKKRVIYLFFSLVIILVGTSRYFINVHYITDIIAGFFFGYLFMLAVIFLYKRTGKSI